MFRATVAVGSSNSSYDGRHHHHCFILVGLNNLLWTIKPQVIVELLSRLRYATTQIPLVTSKIFMIYTIYTYQYQLNKVHSKSKEGNSHQCTLRRWELNMPAWQGLGGACHAVPGGFCRVVVGECSLDAVFCRR